MSEGRALPWTDLVAAIGEERFTEIRDALGAAKLDPLDRDAFLMNGAVGRLLREMMPEEAPAEAVTAYGALLHMSWLAWSAGWPVVGVAEDKLQAALTAQAAPPLSHSPTLPGLCYVQLPPNLVWAEPSKGEPHEPMDGAFVIAARQSVHVLGVLGFRAGRDGFTTMEGAVVLPAPPPPPRADGRAPFASVLPGGERARLISVVDEHELVALALLALDAAAR